MPIRSGQSDNPGTYIVDAENQITRRKEMESVKWKQIYALHKKANDDVIAALSWIKNQPFADSNNIVVSGEGYGGIQVLLTADKDGQSSLGIKCFIVFSSTLGTWNTTWSDVLKQTINIAKRPIYLLQAKNDTNPSPIDSLGIDLNKKIYPNRYKLYPAQVGFSIDPKAWEKDVMQYLKDCGVRRRK
jgi:dienelactone hydrolase